MRIAGDVARWDRLHANETVTSMQLKKAKHDFTKFWARVLRVWRYSNHLHATNIMKNEFNPEMYKQHGIRITKQHTLRIPNSFSWNQITQQVSHKNMFEHQLSNSHFSLIIQSF